MIEVHYSPATATSGPHFRSKRFSTQRLDARPQANDAARIEKQMSEWKLRRSDEEFPIGTSDTLREWAGQARIAADDYVFNPILGKWMYARDVAEISGIFQSKRGEGVARYGCAVCILMLLFAALLNLFGFRPLAILAGVAALVALAVALVAHITALSSPLVGAKALKVIAVVGTASVAVYLGLRVARTNASNREIMDGARNAPATTQAIVRGPEIGIPTAEMNTGATVTVTEPPSAAASAPVAPRRYYLGIARNALMQKHPPEPPQPPSQPATASVIDDRPSLQQLRADARTNGLVFIEISSLVGRAYHEPDCENVTRAMQLEARALAIRDAYHPAWDCHRPGANRQ